MLASLFSSPTLQVTVSEDIVFLHPIDGDYPVCPARYHCRDLCSDLDAVQTQDPVLRGTVLLSLPARKAVKEIRVAFEGLCDVWGERRHP